MDSLLVFTRTLGWRHGNIPAGLAALRKLGREHGFAVDNTEAPDAFAPDILDRYAAVVFFNTSGAVLDDARVDALRRFVEAGRGFAGIHAACDTLYDHPWYGRLVGAYFKSHPVVQPGTVRVADADHPSTSCLPPAWRRWDEWYDFRESPRGRARILLTLDEGTYVGGTMGPDHPIAWCREVDGGRSWYTGLGHTAKGFSDPRYLGHVLGGIRWVLGREG